MRLGAAGWVGLGTAGLSAYEQIKKGRKDRSSQGGGSTTPDADAQPSGYRRGGKVKKTGRATVHKGEVVLTAKQARKRGRKRAGAKR